MADFPSYLSLYESGELARRVEHARSILDACTLCPRRCGVNRAQGERGFCQMGAKPMVSAWNSHHGEEPPLSGTCGSGAIFFTERGLIIRHLVLPHRLAGTREVLAWLANSLSPQV